MDMETEALRWFQQVAEGVTVTEVGELYRVSQPAVSRGIARLEAQVGAPLLRRSGRTLRMTSAGAAFKRHVDALLNDLDDGLAAVEQLVDPETGIVAVASQLSLGTWLLPRLVAGFRAEHPQVRFTLHQSRDELTSSVLADSRVDLEITAQRPVDRSVRWHRLLNEPLYLVVPAGHRLAEATDAELDVVAGEGFVMLRTTSLLRRQATRLCEGAGFAPRVALEGDDVPTVRGLVAAGLGVAVLPAERPGLRAATPRGAHHVPIADPAAAREIGLAWATERRLLPAADLFRQYVVDTSRTARATR